jgi:hypothetical protein
VKRVEGGVRLTRKEHRALIHFWSYLGTGLTLEEAEEVTRQVHRGLSADFYEWISEAHKP